MVCLLDLRSSDGPSSNGEKKERIMERLEDKSVFCTIPKIHRPSLIEIEQ